MTLNALRDQIRAFHLRPETEVLNSLTAAHPIPATTRKAACTRAEALVESIRSDDTPGLMESFLAEYGLSTDEGVALMCLAEALLRVPDSDTIDALIEDKIAPGRWGAHLGQSSSSLVNASTWALMLTGKVLDDDRGGSVAQVLRGALKRLGEPVIRVAVRQAMKELGNQFVLGEDMPEALKRGQAMLDKGYSYSFDMLGEAALTAKDAQAFFDAYADAIAALTPHCIHDDIRRNPGISVKLSALHPRYEVGQHARVMTELAPRLNQLCRQARAAGMGLNIDAEEADRLDLSLDVIEEVLRDPELAGWDGFGVVVQAFGKRAAPVIDWLHALACELDRKIMVRLVKGAYWDTEIKRAQVEGLPGFPVFERKAATDVSYLACAQKLLGLTDRIYPQFATHNAHSVAAILEMAPDRQAFEFQRLHGMGEALHRKVLEAEATRCRIYAPVGPHRDLLAYLVRRLLENGANSSFVNQIVNKDVPATEVAADPFELLSTSTVHVTAPQALFAPERGNSRGFDLHDNVDLARLNAARSPFAAHRWTAAPLISGEASAQAARAVLNPATPSDHVGDVHESSATDIAQALRAASPWQAPASARAQVLNHVADLYEERFGELFALITREAGKIQMDAVAELREAVDFLRYYAARADTLERPARGLFTCISPWNFPLAIFTGQIAAALAAGNGVLAKPAETTTLTAHLAVTLMHEAGVPRSALQLLPGKGSEVGAALTSDPRIAGVCFTGSTATAKRIENAMAEHLPPQAPLIAETGGLNAMIVDSTALPEQAVRDILASSFQSAGQRCSALRILYLQDDIAAPFLQMLYGAMDELVLGDPWDLATDVGPVIDATARAGILSHIDAARAEGRVLKELTPPSAGTFIAPTVIRVNGIEEMAEEIFGPVLHVATFRASELDNLSARINGAGYGLTFGIHSRIDDRIEDLTQALKVGNIYVNRNQIGAVVGSQPFGGEGLSGTGPKAGGPNYVARFTAPKIHAYTGPAAVPAADPGQVQAALTAATPRTAPLQTCDLPGPTGESNRLSTYGRGVVLCLGPTAEAAREQARIARAQSCAAVCVAPGLNTEEGINGQLAPEMLGHLEGIDLVALWADNASLCATRQALAKRQGKIIPLSCEADLAERCRLERHICIDTTAAGGNATLWAEAG